MKIFSGFILKQALLTFVQLSAVCFLLFYLASGYLITVHQQKSEIVKQLLAHHVSNDPKLLARQLRNAMDFQSLSISTAKDVKVFTYVDSDNSKPLSNTLFSNFGPLPLFAEVNNQDLNLKVRFEFSLNNELSLFDNLLAMLLGLSIIFAALNIVIIRQGVISMCKHISTEIAHAIAGFAANQNLKEPFDFSKIPDSFSKVTAAIKTLGSGIDEQEPELTNTVEAPAPSSAVDELTGLPNRTGFVQYFEEHLKTDKSPNSGILTIIRCTELKEINHTRGYHEGDKYVTEVIEMLSKCSANYYNRQIYRLNGSDFALVLPSQSLKEGERFGQNFQHKLNEYQKLNEIDSVAYTGIIQYQPGKPLGELLAMADTAISIAQTKQPNAWHVQQEVDLSELEGAAYGTQNWRQVIEEVISQSRVALIFQEIAPCNRTERAYAEILTRFKTAEGQILPTASFLAMAEKLDKIIDADRMIVEFSLKTLGARPSYDRMFGLNIHAKSVHSEKFVNWLDRQLKENPALAKTLVFEVPEQGLQQNLKASRRFIDMLHRNNVHITVERFGVGLTSFKFFRDLKPDFIKMDGSYTRGIDEDQNNQYFLRLMIELAHRINVKVIAEGVETEAEKAALQQLGIDGNQGYFIGKPQQF